MRALAVVLLVASAAPALGDDDGEGNPPAPSDPVPVAVEARLDGTVVQLTTTWTVDVAHEGWTESTPVLVLPAGTIATAATATVRGQSHRLVLQPADKAHAAFEDLVASSAPGPRGWAVGLHLADPTAAERIAVDIAAPRSERVTLTLEATQATCFFEDTRIFRIPATWQAALSPALRKLVLEKSDALDAACPWDGDEQEMLRIALPSGELAERPVGDRRIDGIAMRLPLDDKDLTRVELDLSSQISAVPADLHTVFLVDASRSMTPHDLDIQRAVMVSYMQHAASTYVQALAYARRPTPLLPAWTVASAASPRIVRALENVPTRNGSDIDVALAEAGRLLEPVQGTRRIVLFTDELLAARISQMPLVGLRRLVPDGTVIQVVVVAEDHGALERDDEAELASLATATNGFAVKGRVDDNGQVDAKMLVRPITLDDVTVRAAGWHNLDDAEAPACPPKLAEGQSCVFVADGSAVSGPIAIEGLLWGRRFTRVLRPDPVHARTLARILVASDRQFGDENVQNRIAELAQAVTTASALFGRWGGKGGYGEVVEGMITGGTLGSLSSTDVVDTAIGRLDPAEVKLDLGPQLQHVIDACHASSYRVELDVETTLQEIVDVSVTVQSINSDRAQALRTCITEGVWDTMLALPNPPVQQTVHLVY